MQFMVGFQNDYKIEAGCCACGSYPPYSRWNKNIESDSVAYLRFYGNIMASQFFFNWHIPFSVMKSFIAYSKLKDKCIFVEVLTNSSLSIKKQLITRVSKKKN